MDLEQLPDRLTQGMHGLRDRTADMVGADGGSVFRELGKLSRRLDDTKDTLSEQIDDSGSMLADRIDEMAASDRRTSWPRRMFWMAVGAGIGMAVEYLADPDRGASRRNQLSDQISARTRETAEEATGSVKDAAARARGQMVEQVKGQLPNVPENDAALLEQRIKSEVMGHRDDVTGVVLRIDGPGKVALKGTVPTPAAERELLASVSEVDGVIDVSSELAVKGS